MLKKREERQILITGGAGFIGSHLVDYLLREGGWRVIVVDNFDPFYAPSTKRANIAPHLANPHFRLYEADIRRPDQLRKVFAENSPDTIVHLAARAGVRPSLENPGAYIDTNVSGTLNLLECARASRVAHFIFGSSSSVYGADAKVPFSETEAAARPISPYAASKAAGELLCHTYAHLYAVRCVCLRFFTVYGARQRPDLAIHKFASLIRAGKPVPMFGDGRTRRDYTFVDDVVHGVRAAMDYDETMYEVFNLGEEQTVELRALVAMLETCLGKRAIVERLPMQAGDVPVTFADVSKAREMLGYEPQTKLGEGLPRFVEWFLKQEMEHNAAII